MRGNSLRNGMILVDRKGRKYELVSFKLDSDKYFISAEVKKLSDGEIEKINKTLFNELRFTEYIESLSV